MPHAITSRRACLALAIAGLLLAAEAQAFFFCFSFGGGSRPHAGPWRASHPPPPYPPFHYWPPAGLAMPAYDPGQWQPLSQAGPPAAPHTATPVPAPETPASILPAAKP